MTADTRWHSMRGGISRYECPVRGSVTVFTIQAATPTGGPWGQRIEIETWRLDYPGNYRRVLDQITREIQARIG